VHANILQLAGDLCEITTALKNSRLALAHCEAALISSWEKLNEERLAHQACRGELRDATMLVHRAVGAATQSGQAADVLATEAVELRAALQARQADLTWKGA
jgi:hypothetical protein